MAQEIAREIAHNNAALKEEDDGTEAGSLKQKILGADVMDIYNTDACRVFKKIQRQEILQSSY